MNFGNFSTFDKRQQKLALSYLAYIHVSGWTPQNIQTREDWGTWLMCAYTCSQVLGRCYDVKPENVALVQDHPMVRNFERFRAEGFKMDRSFILHRGRTRYTLKRGINMTHADGREIVLHADGKVTQVKAEGGRWEWKEDILAVTA